MEAKIIISCTANTTGEDGSADLKHILKVADDLGKIMTEYKVTVDKALCLVELKESE